MEIEQLIKEIRDNLSETDDLSQLSDWDNRLSVSYAWIATQLAEVKKNRALKEIEIKKEFVDNQRPYTEKEIERRYFSLEEGQYYVYATEIMKGISKLISAIRFKREMLR